MHMRAKPLAAEGVTASRRVWLTATLTTAVLVTAVDAVLLQLKKAFFTGGFLSDSHTRGPLEALGFIAASLASDIALAAPLAALTLLAVHRLRLTDRARRLAVTLGAAVPLVIAEFITYRIASFLGDAFDLSLLFDLTGRRPSEFLAVAAGQLAAPLAALLATVGCVVVLVRLVNRGDAVRGDGPRPLRILGAAVVAALVLGTAVSAARVAAEVYDDGVQRKASGRAIASVLEYVSDIDRDGYGVGEAPADAAPFDASIHPYAIDVPGNGIDEDGIGGDLALSAPYAEGASSAGASWTEHPNVVFIVLESFRSDAFGKTINGKPVTPNLSALAARGVSAPLAFSHNGYTAQSRFHLFSGSIADLRQQQTLIDDFKRNGYEVGYFSGQDDSFGGAAYSVGLERADVEFDARQARNQRYTTFSTAGSLAVPFDVVEARLAKFLATRRTDRPLFLYINFHDTHFPYSRKGLAPLVSKVRLDESRIEPSNADAVKEMYYNTAANVDAAIGTTLEAIAKHLGAPPAVIVTGDHGESLFDEGFLGHGYALNDVQTRVPLIVAGLPMTITEPFVQADLRDEIGAALSGHGGGPTVVRSPTKQVFQYLGKIDKPRAIGFVSADGRLVYDFRSGEVQSGGSWKKPSALTGADAQRFQDLVHLWERMVLARSQNTSARRE
jgi:hypothetical protein